MSHAPKYKEVQAGFLDSKNPRFGIESFRRIQMSHIKKDLFLDIARVIPIRAPCSVKDFYDVVVGFGNCSIPTRNDSLFDQR